jgi:predicted DNA-binding ribbon-helix-helix protein
MVLFPYLLDFTQHLIKELKEAGKKHYGNFNSELIVALEQYLTN